MPEIDEEELKELRATAKRVKQLEAELDRAKTPSQVENVQDKLADMARSIRDDMEKLHAEDRAERAALQEQLKKVEEELKEAKKKADEADKIKGGTSTIVVPPSDLGRQIVDEPRSEPRPSYDDEKPRRSWKSIW